MTVFVARLGPWGWKPHGEEVESCHLFTNTLELAELHAMAAATVMQRAWFRIRSQRRTMTSTTRRRLAVACGAVEVEWDVAAVIWRMRRAPPRAGPDAVLLAVELALESAPPSGRVSVEHVLNVLGRLNAGPAPENVETRLQLVEAPRADAGRYDRLRVAGGNAEEIDHA